MLSFLAWLVRVSGFYCYVGASRVVCFVIMIRVVSYQEKSGLSSREERIKSLWQAAQPILNF